MNIPNHIAVIMDGNGRWAEQRHRPRVFGHIRGAARVKPLILEADRLGVQALTLFAFSTENWMRPESELEVLWKLLKKILRREMAELHRNNVHFRVIGEVERLRSDVRTIVDEAVALMKNNDGLELTFAVSYGGRRDLVRAAQLFAEDCVEGHRRPFEMSEDLMWKYLWTRDMGELADVDLVIRTSGEQRVSNFLIWQAAYAEYVFSDFLWPDFGKEEFGRVLEEFSRRNRRFGKVTANLSPRVETGVEAGLQP